MLPLMAKNSKAKVYPRPEGKKDVFARLNEDVVDKLDELVSDIEPATSRSALIAMMIERYVAEHYPKREKRKG